MTEQWKDVEGYEGLYQVSNMGRVKSFHHDKVHGRILKPKEHRDGYLQVDLYRGGKRKTQKIHRLVAEAFLGSRPSPDHEVNHKNGNKLDNRIENLEWVTHSENTTHAFRVLGKQPPRVRGEVIGTSKLTEIQVQRIRELCKTGKHTQRELGKMFGVSQMQISRIFRRKQWQHVL